MSRLEHIGFGGLRGDANRDWHRMSDLINASHAEGYRMTRYEVLKAVAFLPKPEKRYGHYRYTNEHMEAVRAYAARMGWKATKETTNV